MASGSETESTKQQLPATQQPGLPPSVQKWADTGQLMDQIVGETCLSKTASMGNFARAMATAVAVQELRKALTDQNMQPIMALQGTALGFRTDKDKESGYPMAIVRDCVIDAALRGASLVGNEFNIIAERSYYTKEYYQRVTGNLPNVSNMEPSFGVPQFAAQTDFCQVEVDCTWRYDGKPCRLTPGPGRDKGRILSIRVNKGQGPDQVLGKATRKLLKAVFEQITGSPSGDDGDTDDVIEASATPAASSPPIGRVPIGDKSKQENGGFVARGPACKDEWQAMQKFVDAYGSEIVNDAKSECGYGEIPLDQCHARQLGEVINQMMEREMHGTAVKPEPAKAGSGKAKGKLDF